MSIIEHRLIVCVTVLLCFCGICNSQPATSYKEADKLGLAILKKLKTENLSHSMQYVVLKKGRRLKKQMKDPNTVYEVRYLFDLKSSELSVPDNCVIVLNGGNFKNGTIRGNNTQYCAKSEVSFDCDTVGSLKRVNYIVRASDAGMISNSGSAANINYKSLRKIVDEGFNVFLDGHFEIKFDKPIELTNVFYIYGGNLLYEKNAFRCSNEGGIVVNGTSIKVSTKTPDSFFCGQKEYLGPVSIKTIAFYGCDIDCSNLVNIYFEDINSDKTPYGVEYLEMDHCVLKNNGRVRVLDGILSKKCSFTNNYYQSFTSTPIYICCHHSVEASPDDKTAYKYIGQNLPKGAPVVIRGNIFIGKVVSVNTYYCAALIKSRECDFVGNYIQDVINYNDNAEKLTGTASAYDAYLSCVNVLYEGNFVKDVMSFSKNGKAKPSCQVGKSKTNPLYSWGWNSERIFRNNCFIVNGDKFMKLGADENSLYAEIFGNGTYINHYMWSNNTLVFNNAALKTGVAANSYGTFEMENNYFEVARTLGNGLVTVRSDQQLEEVCIRKNTIRQVETNQLFPLFNQKFNQKYQRENQKLIQIEDNQFYNTSPEIYFFTGKKILVRNNSSDKSNVDRNIYLSKYNGSGAYLDVEDMDAQMQFVDLNDCTGGLYQYISSFSTGKYSVCLKDLPQKGVYYIYNLDKDHSFTIDCSICSVNRGTIQISIPCQYIKGKFMYEWDGKRVNVPNKKTSSQIWYKDSAVAFRTTFYPSDKAQVYFYLIPGSQASSLSSVVLTYRTE